MSSIEHIVGAPSVIDVAVIAAAISLFGVMISSLMSFAIARTQSRDKAFFELIRKELEVLTNCRGTLWRASANSMALKAITDDTVSDDAKAEFRADITRVYNAHLDHGYLFSLQDMNHVTKTLVKCGDYNVCLNNELFADISQTLMIYEYCIDFYRAKLGIRRPPIDFLYNFKRLLFKGSGNERQLSDFRKFAASKDDRNPK